MSNSTGTGEGMEQVEKEPDTVGEIIDTFLVNRVPVFRKLCELRAKGWKSKNADEYWKIQRETADNAGQQTSQAMYRHMENNGEELHNRTGAFSILPAPGTSTGILDFGAAPGGFLSVALRMNPQARALAITLPEECGGYPIRLSPGPNLAVKYLDVTMLAADMGTVDIHPSHPDAANFLPPVFTIGLRPFNLIICGGSVVRVHARADYRQHREASRLICSQLAIGMEHIKSGGTLVVLLHRLERWDNIRLIQCLSSFSSVQLCKPKKGHAKRNSVYLVAKQVQPQQIEALAAVEEWKNTWRIATFGRDEDYAAMHAVTRDEATVRKVLEKFGDKLVDLGREVWAIQADALERHLDSLE